MASTPQRSAMMPSQSTTCCPMMRMASSPPVVVQLLGGADLTGQAAMFHVPPAAVGQRAHARAVDMLARPCTELQTAGVASSSDPVMHQLCPETQETEMESDVESTSTEDGMLSTCAKSGSTAIETSTSGGSTPPAGGSLDTAGTMTPGERAFGVHSPPIHSALAPSPHSLVPNNSPLLVLSCAYGHDAHKQAFAMQQMRGSRSLSPPSPPAGPGVQASSNPCLYQLSQSAAGLLQHVGKAVSGKQTDTFGISANVGRAAAPPSPGPARTSQHSAPCSAPWCQHATVGGNTSNAHTNQARVPSGGLLMPQNSAQSCGTRVPLSLRDSSPGQSVETFFARLPLRQTQPGAVEASDSHLWGQSEWSQLRTSRTASRPGVASESTMHPSGAQSTPNPPTCGRDAPMHRPNVSTAIVGSITGCLPISPSKHVPIASTSERLLASPPSKVQLVSPAGCRPRRRNTRIPSPPISRPALSRAWADENNKDSVQQTTDKASICSDQAGWYFSVAGAASSQRSSLAPSLPCRAMPNLSMSRAVDVSCHSSESNTGVQDQVSWESLSDIEVHILAKRTLHGEVAPKLLGRLDRKDIIALLKAHVGAGEGPSMAATASSRLSARSCSCVDEAEPLCCGRWARQGAEPLPIGKEVVHSGGRNTAARAAARGVSHTRSISPASRHQGKCSRSPDTRSGNPGRM